MAYQAILQRVSAYLVEERLKELHDENVLANWAEMIKHKVLSFMDGCSRYNQIFIAEKDTTKMAFRYPRLKEMFEYVVMCRGNLPKGNGQHFS